jgi:phosphotransferase system enzyme I (PtsI)
MSSPADQAKAQTAGGEHVLEGIAGSPGFALGPAIVVDRSSGIIRRHVTHQHIEDEIERFDRAVASAAAKLEATSDMSGRTQAETSILGAYVAMTRDETLRAEVERRVRIDFLCAEWALSVTIDEMMQQLGQAGDSYLAERRHDIGFVGQGIIQSLTGQSESPVLPRGREPSVLVAHDLSPAETVTLRRENVLAIVTGGCPGGGPGLQRGRRPDL